MKEKNISIPEKEYGRDDTTHIAIEAWCICNNCKLYGNT